MNIDAVKYVCRGTLGLTNEEEIGKALQDEIRVRLTLKSEDEEKINEYCLFSVCRLSNGQFHERKSCLSFVKILLLSLMELS